MELAIVLIIALVIVGPKKLPTSAARRARACEFKDSVTGDKDDEKPQITEAKADVPVAVQGEVVANRS
jgi:Sec-independent protein translocase protein TatA